MDKDVDDNAVLHYTISGGRNKGVFSIHPHTGVVFSDRSFIAGEEYSLQVSVIKVTLFMFTQFSSTSSVWRCKSVLQKNKGDRIVGCFKSETSIWLPFRFFFYTRK